jgi:hypothetical protein
MRRPQKYRVSMTYSASKVVDVYAFSEADAASRASARGFPSQVGEPMPAAPRTIEEDASGWTVTKVELAQK